ncbi:hypothetical protein J2T09_002896 [Neorhizobium huautlense]|uniref:Uncharacterized protein n=1 Tax=Neorhizobium huautlense TaxID=67774 RepID=A0ABT9PW80_9HYPH|nr:hypothetical protein [Neorhizobium huautlense]MDP9838129.1 hypothetical protein [Neorhizobium huautlense]
MTIIARRMTILTLVMAVFALSFSALVSHHGKGSISRLNAQALCSGQYGCTAQL